MVKHALNEYYNVIGDPGDKVCFQPQTLVINVSRASIKNYMGVIVLGAILYT